MSKTQKFSTPRRNCTKINKSYYTRTHTRHHHHHKQSKQNAHSHRWAHSQTLLIFLKFLAFSSWHKRDCCCDRAPWPTQLREERAGLVLRFRKVRLHHGSKQRGGGAGSWEITFTLNACAQWQISSSKAALPNPPNSATNWIPKVQTPKPVGDIVIKPSEI